MQKPETSDYLKLHFIVLILGFTAILGKLTTISTIALVLYRTSLAAVGMGVLSKIQRKKLFLGFAKALPLMLCGALISIHWLCFFGSAKISTVAISLVAVSTTSFFTSIFDPLSKGKKISFIEVFLGIIVVIGIAIIFAFEFRYLLGLSIGLFGAMLGSIFSITNSNFAKNYDSRQVIFYEMIGAFITALLFLPIFLYFSKNEPISFIPTSLDMLWIAILSLVCTIYPYIGMQDLLKKISAFTLNLAINLEPIYGIILGYLIFGEKEKMNLGFYFGAVIILSSVLAYPFLQRKFSTS